MKTRPAKPIFALFALSVMVLGGCKGWFSSDENNSPVVAKYKNETLNLDQLNQYVPQGVSSQDSIRYSKFYIDEWIREKAIADVALREIPNLESTIEFKVQDYRRKLILNEYTAHLIQQKLDTAISHQRVREYYETEKSNFISQEDLFAYFYIVVGDKSTRGVSEMMESDVQEDLDNLVTWARDNSLDYKLDSSFVVSAEIDNISKGYFGDLKKSRKGKLIRWNGVKQGQQRKYFFKLLEIVKQGEPLPLSLVENRIRSILLNERKITLIESTDEKILQDARQRNYIQINY
ncbi:MAG: hypothetical protein H6581_30670 [Bacteroidia bacterium]|nr:hypothetical protein [Bacteroidia bacterium]